MHGQGHAIGAMPCGHATQLPESVLQPFTEAGEALREAERHMLPVRARQHEVVDQVREGLPRKGHLQRVHTAEVGGADNVINSWITCRDLTLCIVCWLR